MHVDEAPEGLRAPLQTSPAERLGEAAALAPHLVALLLVQTREVRLVIVRQIHHRGDLVTGDRGPHVRCGQPVGDHVGGLGGQ